MKRHVKRVKFFLLGLLSLPFLTAPVFANCPTPQEVLKGLASFSAKGVQVVAIKPTPYTEICEVHIRVQNRDRIIYAGAGSAFFLMGQLYDASSGRNLTRIALETVTQFSPEEITLLNDLTAFSIGKPDNTLYFITDPQCPYCKEGTRILKKLVSTGKVRVNFILFPLPAHKGAKEQSVSVICDGKSLPEFESGYRSDSQCAEGIMKIKDTFNLLKKKGIGGTPTYIFSDGRFHTGLIKEAELRRRLRLPASE